MADVILIYPRTLWDIVNVTTRLPLAALYIGTVLQENGFSVQVIDQRVDAAWETTLREALRDPPLWVGVSAMTGRQIEWGLAASRIARQVAPDVPIVWGGVHPTILPEQTLAHPLVDVVAVGEGEITALELSQALREHGPHARLSSTVIGAIAGLVWEQDGRVIHNVPRFYTPMDDWPLLDYGLVNVEHYVLSEVPGERSLQITTSRGCPWHCGYCYLTVVPDGRRYRAEAPERTVARIERLLRTFDLNAIHIIDDEFFTRRERARRVCELIVERGIEVTLRTNCRIDYVDRMSMDDLRLFRRAGFKHLYLGAEAGNDRVLAFIRKDITREQIVRVNLKLKAAGIAPKFSFMGGFPTESVDEVKDTIRLMARLVRDNPGAYTTPVQLYSPYPGTELYEHCAENDMVVPEDLEGWAESGWEHIDYSWLSPEEEAFLQKAAYFTFFLDGKTVPESMRSPVMRLLARAYGWLVRLRVSTDFYRWMPEVRLIKWALANTK
ncbi:MAG: B12-binding domain-containing radical SAM protein [Anaerolineae bacterium]|nr:B12-binding domain-containing radical SAM protein [Anaerolineae bacterium]